MRFELNIWSRGHRHNKRHHNSSWKITRGGNKDCLHLFKTDNKEKHLQDRSVTCCTAQERERCCRKLNNVQNQSAEDSGGRKDKKMEVRQTFLKHFRGESTCSCGWEAEKPTAGPCFKIQLLAGGCKQAQRWVSWRRLSASVQGAALLNFSCSYFTSLTFELFP